MHKDEHVEENEEPPLLLSSRPPCGKHTHTHTRAGSYAGGSGASADSCLCVIFQVFVGGGRTAAVQCRWGDGCECPQCPAGQEPSKVRQGTSDRSCPPGSFSDALGPELCHPHASCRVLGRAVAAPGTASSDSVCGGSNQPCQTQK
uniref:TNFR-Cys domain-containing protein n=1 Tax=Kryptolebias marmoratus TaxID=37003 RepID=A0A3Q3A679_KRYMA